LCEITCIIVNFKTKHLTEKALETFRKFYAYPVVLIDNHSDDESTEFCKNAGTVYNDITVLLNNKNIGHGPAMHYGTLLATTEYVFTLDSDTETLQGGFLEQMLQRLQETENSYAIGWERWVNLDGVSGIKNGQNLTPYIHPYAMLFEKAKYLTLPTFAMHGAPCVYNMYEANRKQYALLDFNLALYIKHLVAGTRRLYKGHWYDGDTNFPYTEWDAKKTYPI